MISCRKPSIGRRILLGLDFVFVRSCGYCSVLSVVLGLCWSWGGRRIAWVILGSAR